MENAYIIGFGAFGTSISKVLEKNSNINIYVYDINEEILEDVRNNKKNSKYFPNFELSNLRFIKPGDKIEGYIFLTLPSKVIHSWVLKNNESIGPTSIIINMSKGFDTNGGLIYDLLKFNFPENLIITGKGPTFSDELIRGFPSLITFASERLQAKDKMKKLFEKTNVNIEFSTDYKGVEILSVLKNIYSIFIGIVDARYNAANTTFLAFSKSTEEIYRLSHYYGGISKTLLTSAGIGDFGLTSLNDLSRNRTFGLFVGKGFYESSKNVSNSVLIEGLRSIELVYKSTVKDSNGDYPILDFLYAVFFRNTDLKYLNKLLMEI